MPFPDPSNPPQHPIWSRSVASLAGPLVDDGAALIVARPRAVAVGPPTDAGVARSWRVVVVMPVRMVNAPRRDDFLVVVVLCLWLGAEAHCCDVECGGRCQTVDGD